MAGWLWCLGEGSDAFGDFDGLDWALDLACAAEDAVPFPHRVRFPAVEKGFAAVVGGLLIDLLLLRGEIHLIEDIDRAD